MTAFMIIIVLSILASLAIARDIFDGLLIEVLNGFEEDL